MLYQMIKSSDLCRSRVYQAVDIRLIGEFDCINEISLLLLYIHCPNKTQ